MSQEKYWSLLAPGTHLPRLWLVLPQEHADRLGKYQQNPGNRGFSVALIRV